MTLRLPPSTRRRCGPFEVSPIAFDWRGLRPRLLARATTAALSCRGSAAPKGTSPRPFARLCKRRRRWVLPHHRGVHELGAGLLLPRQVLQQAPGVPRAPALAPASPALQPQLAGRAVPPAAVPDRGRCARHAPTTHPRPLCRRRPPGGTDRTGQSDANRPSFQHHHGAHGPHAVPWLLLLVPLQAKKAPIMPALVPAPLVLHLQLERGRMPAAALPAPPWVRCARHVRTTCPRPLCHHHPLGGIGRRGPGAASRLSRVTDGDQPQQRAVTVRPPFPIPAPLRRKAAVGPAALARWVATAGREAAAAAVLVPETLAMEPRIALPPSRRQRSLRRQQPAWPWKQGRPRRLPWAVTSQCRPSHAPVANLEGLARTH